MSALIVINVVSGAVVAVHPADRRTEVHLVLAPAGGGGLRAPGGGSRRHRLRGRRGSRQTWCNANARPGPPRRMAWAAWAVPVWVSLAVPLAMLGLVAVTARSRSRCARGRMSAVQAIAAGRAPTPKARIPCAPAARPGPSPAPAGDHRPGRAVRTAHPDPGHPRGDRVRRHRGDLRGRPAHVAEPVSRRPVPRSVRAGAGPPGRTPGSGPGQRKELGQAEPGRPRARRAGRAGRPVRDHYILWRRPAARSACSGYRTSCPSPDSTATPAGPATP